MNATNRVLNRAVLLLVGVVLAAVGAGLILPSLPWPWAKNLLDTAQSWAEDAVSGLNRWSPEVAGVGSIAGTVLVALAGAVLLLVLLIVFLASRGGGRTATLVQIGSERGSTRVDTSVAEGVLAARLREQAEVQSAHTEAYRVRSTPAIRLTVTTRRGAQLSRVLSAVEAAVAHWDALLGTEIPVVVHLADRRRHERRLQ